jgi:Na+-transporting methylmalonyl-CoA/oxaloacetate decarboxylase gamma subunit
MRRIAVFVLLLILAVAGTMPASAQLRTPQENARASRKAAKKQQKYLKKANKQQKKATKKALKQQRKENKRNNQTLHHK